MKRSLQKSGFTLFELMVALLIASIVLAATSTLAGAVTAADDITDEMGREQAQLRLVSMRLTDLIRRANQVTLLNGTGEEGFTLWHDNNADGLATADELTTVQRGADGNTLTIGASEVHSQCQNIAFLYSVDTRFITVSFDMTENGQTQHHSINARLWASDDHRQF